MDWSEKISCIKCDRGGNLLACCENDCPLAIHEGCLGCPAEFDESGRFRCPYCLYKQSVAELRRAREYFLGKKKAFSNFMNEKVIASEKRIGENKTCEDNGQETQDESKTSNQNLDAALSGDGKTSKLNNNGIIDKPFQIDEEEKTSNPVEDSEDSAGSKGRDPSPEIHGGKINRTDEEKQLEEEDHETSAEKQMIQDEEHETSSDPSFVRLARAKRGSKRSKRVDEDSDADPVQSKLLKQHRLEKPTSPTATPTKKSATAMRIGNLRTEEVVSPWRSRKPEEPLAKLETFTGAKRSKPLWTEEEEEALRAGVEAHSKEPKLPWKKILETGRASNQFDPTRSPGDLKGKWRKISGR